MSYSQYAWLIPLFPLLSFLLLTAAGKQWRDGGGWIGVLSALFSFLGAVLVFIERLGGQDGGYSWSYGWIQLADSSLTIGFEVTNLNALMLVIVTFVSLLVQVYSTAYMHGDERIHVFFSYVCLFTFSMLGLVLSQNLLQLYLFWELVGVCSFLLVGFWYTKPEAKAAAKKAFIVTRIGDVGLFLALLLLYWNMPGHALDFTSIQNAVMNQELSSGLLTWIAVLIFVGAIGKSGQFPLHTWLPDAMEGPTPISALIHAATMVAAGVYLVARTYDIFQASPDALAFVAAVGGFTAIFAATIGMAQNDIKRILAYSTVSQLGYMMMALGLGSVTAGMFHLTTHAFFKALLFLGAGSVIHAVHKQHIDEMGGLGRRMKITAWTFAIGALALSGIPPFSGFWSKDAILSAAYDQNKLLFGVGLITAFFTAFYMARLFFLVFAGEPAGKESEAAEESPPSITVPLVLLAVPAVLAGLIYTPFNSWFGTWLTDGEPEEHVNYIVMLLSVLAGASGIVLGYLIYAQKRIPRDFVSRRWPGLVRLLAHKYYIDEMYDRLIVRPLRTAGHVLQIVDDWVIGGLVRFTAAGFTVVGKAGVRAQNGQIQTYGLLTLLGFVVFVIVIAGRRFW
ncbi:NADH-quinone oxidoreductase subunit L [Paenibacillus gansuensis]|uniref:NADH-quinone oxidoreductase subunit L n=1 Tax=Paenibacillus gansuensis TaxID=306542 RepID=A0ABW5PLU6_9BACL